MTKTTNKKTKPSSSTNQSSKGDMKAIAKVMDITELAIKDTDKRMYLTHIGIDTIAVVGQLNLTNEEKEQITKKCYLDCKHTEFELSEDYNATAISYKDCRKNGFKFGYYYQRIGGNYGFRIFFYPTNKFARFCKIEFSLHKAGKKGYEEIQEWFDSTIVHTLFDDFINADKAITRVDFFADVICEQPFSEFIYLLNDKVKSQRWHREDGLLESVYSRKSSGQVDRRAYNKWPEEHPDEQDNFEADTVYETKTSSMYQPIYDQGLNVIRIEKQVSKFYKTPETLAYNTVNHFRDIKMFSLAFKQFCLELDGYDEILNPYSSAWLGFMDSIRYRGFENACLQLYECTEQNMADAFIQVFNEHHYNILSQLNGKSYWNDRIPKYLKNMGILNE